MAVVVLSLVVAEAITFSPLGTRIYAAATAGSPGAAIAPMDFGIPAGTLVTGRS
jgi:hypothetical protein